MTLHDYLVVWLDTYIGPTKAANTINAYRSALAHLSPGILAAEITTLQPIQLQREVNQLAAVYSRQAQILHTVLHAACKRAVQLRMLPGNPMDLVDKPAHARQESEYLYPVEAVRYCAAAQEQPAGALLVLMLCLGLRRNEARGLRCGDMDADGILHIRHQRTRSGGLARLKSASSRRDLPVPLPLRGFFSGDSGDFVADVSEKSLRTQHRRVLACIGCDRRVTLHGLRHTAATLAIMYGAELVTVQQMLGHRHISLTADLYVHHAVQIIQPTINVLSGHFFNPSNGRGARLEIV